ncbi:MAG TPA: alpha/beta hydrolase [Dehalococcoidia bacterium]|jgi:acetyl esterase/lipase|nr:alpha/beta hydrolase [Dehalococcoidia bacterium]
MTVMLDPKRFSEEAVSEETRAFNQRLAELSAAAPSMTDLPPEETRAARAKGGMFGEIVKLDQAQERTIPGPGGDIPLRVFTPERVDGVHLYIHGGGWVLGAADAQDERLWELATTANVAVVSVEYRLAPEHPYPAGPDDCEAAALWLRDNAQAELGSDRLTIGGGSAGGHLAAVTLLRLRDRFGDTGFLAADLVFGVFDLSMTPSQKAGVESPVIPTATMDWFYGHFVPDPVTRKDPDISPLYADLRGLPPALFTVGTYDPLLDDSLFMAQRWQVAGNVAEIEVYPGGVHGFVAFPIAIGAEARERSTQFIAAAVAG